jgi:hypothetical protein
LRRVALKVGLTILFIAVVAVAHPAASVITKSYVPEIGALYVNVVGPDVNAVNVPALTV